MSEHVCPGNCNRRYRAEWEAYHRAVDVWQAVLQARTARLAEDPDTDLGPEPERPAEPKLRPYAGAPIWCLADATAIRSALVDLDEQMTLHLLSQDGHGSLPLQERVAGSPEPASPSPAHDTLDELVEWLSVWEQALRESQGWPAKPYRGQSAPALTSAVGWLASRLDTMLARPDLAEDFGDGVLRWHRRLESAAKTRPRRVTKQLRCPQCHLATLSQLEGEDRIECRNRSCGESRGGPIVLTVDEYDGLAQAALDNAKAARRSA